VCPWCTQVRHVKPRMLALVAVLAALTVTWSALPVRSGPLPWALVGIAGCSAVCSLLEMSVQGIEVHRSAFETFAARQTRVLVTGVRSAPWAELMMVAVLLLEAEHADRPWHTGVLLVALLGYLLAVHLAETGAPPRTLRAQLPPLAVGTGLAVLAIGAGELPGLPAGAAGTAVRIVAAAAAVCAAAMVIPTWLSKDS
jgi:hypothetical protein